MGKFSTLLQQGSAWFFIPSATLLGVLRGLEPGHLKTTIVVSIITIKGTIKQAVTLGLAATLLHTAVVRLVALGGMYISKALTVQAVEPQLQFISAIIILGTVFWVFWRTWQEEQNWLAQTHHNHDHGRHYHHDHDDHHHDHDDDRHHHYHHHHRHRHHEHEHNHNHAALAKLTEGSKEYQGAHGRAHVTDIQRRLADKEVISDQILLLGLTGGLILCPATIMVLLACIQLKAFTLDVTMMLCFNFGLVPTLATMGVGTAVNVQQAAKRWSGFNMMTRRAPCFSSVLIAMVGLYMGIHGYMGIAG